MAYTLLRHFLEIVYAPMLIKHEFILARHIQWFPNKDTHKSALDPK